MNLYKILKVLVLAMLILPTSSYAQSQNKTQIDLDAIQLNTKQLLERGLNRSTDVYCNQRFNFCFRYPADFFTKEMTGDNSDGIFLNNSQEGVQITAYAYHATDGDIETTWESAIKLIQEKSDAAEASVSMITNEDIIQAEYLNDDNFVHVYTQLYDDKWVNIEIQVENKMGTDDDQMFKYLIELITHTLEINEKI